MVYGHICLQGILHLDIHGEYTCTGRYTGALISVGDTDTSLHTPINIDFCWKCIFTFMYIGMYVYIRSYIYIYRYILYLHWKGMAYRIFISIYR